MNKSVVNKTEQIWRELSDRLRQFVRSRINSDSDVDDIVQTVFLGIHSRLDSLRDTERIESWVFQIARNAIVDHYRKKRAGQTDVESLADSASEDSGGNADEVRKELAGCLGSFIERLPDDQKNAVKLYELEGISQKEIADRVAISLSGAKSRIQRGRQSLLQMLNDCCEFQFDGKGNVIDYESSRSNCCDSDCH